MTFTEEEIQTMISMYNEGKSAAAICEVINTTPHTILNHLRKRGIQIRNKAGYHPPINDSYFDIIDSERKAYFLGYLMADGNVMKRKQSQPVVRMEIGRQDRYILEELKCDLDAYTNVLDTRKNCCSLRIHSQKLFDSLAKYGITPNRIKSFPQQMLPSNFIHHFIRGFFDGDGWVTLTTHGRIKRTLNLGFCGNLKMMIDLRDFFEKTLNTFHLKISERGNICNLIYSSQKDVKALCEYMYQDATIFLSRKKDKYINFFHVNTETA